MLNLVDDGTLDTVFECEACGEHLRWNSDEITREADGGPDAKSIRRCTREHDDECEGREEPSFTTLAEWYHGGQWSALYAFSSSGTVTRGLTNEVRFAVKAENTRRGRLVEKRAMLAFLEWAEKTEDAKYPNDD